MACHDLCIDLSLIQNLLRCNQIKAKASFSFDVNIILLTHMYLIIMVYNF
jgi:hypothetical protein